jgi:flagellar hook protein FlgE
MDPSAIASCPADAILGTAGGKIASFRASSPGDAEQDAVDLSAALVVLLSAKNQYSATVRKRRTKSKRVQSI